MTHTKEEHRAGEREQAPPAPGLAAVRVLFAQVFGAIAQSIILFLCRSTEYLVAITAYIM